METQKQIRDFRKSRDWSQTELADKLGVTPSHISMLESGKRELTMGLFKKLMDVGFGGEFSRTGESIGDTLWALAERSDRNEEVQPIHVEGNEEGDVIIEHFESVIRAGNSDTVHDQTTRKFNVSNHYRGTASYEVSGDSMVGAGIEEGDRLIVRLGYQFRNNDVILCNYNGQLMVKGARIIDGVIWLIPANEKYHPWPCKETDDLHVIGTVIEIIRAPDRGALRAIKINTEEA